MTESLKILKCKIHNQYQSPHLPINLLLHAHVCAFFFFLGTNKRFVSCDRSFIISLSKLLGKWKMPVI